VYLPDCQKSLGDITRLIDEASRHQASPNLDRIR